MTCPPAVAALAAFLLLPTGRSAAQESARHAARFLGGSVTWDEFYLELARRHRGSPFGREALDHLIERAIVLREARARGLTASREEVEDRLRLTRDELAKHRMSLEKHLEQRAMGLAEFRAYVELSVVYERLARADLGLEPQQPLSQEQRELWLREQRRRHAVEVEIDKLPYELGAKVGDQKITLHELGRAMARNLAASERESILKQMVAYRLLQGEVARLEVTADQAAHAAELDRRRAEFRANEEYRSLGIDFDSFLHAQGRTLDDFQQGEAFRAQVLVGLLGRKLFPLEELRRQLAADEAKWLGRVGVAREVLRLWLQGPPKRPASEARGLADKLRQDIRAEADFVRAAQKLGEDPEKRRGGKVGFLHRLEPGWDEAVLATIFAVEPGKVSQPVADRGGVSLFFVSRVRPAPEGDDLLLAMRDYEMGAWLRGLVERARVEYGALPTV